MGTGWPSRTNSYRAGSKPAHIAHRGRAFTVQPARAPLSSSSTLPGAVFAGAVVAGRRSHSAWTARCRATYSCLPDRPMFT
ncbi:hypothetical protein BJF90_06420 [Pseudonocardia sp. CNS-004]|nr:hypothetical protein BJF90_06420 [Pseudonocardia sp. CNS-004]